MRTATILILLLIAGLLQSNAQTQDTVVNDYGKPKLEKPLHHIVSTNIADVALQKWNMSYEYLPNYLGKHGHYRAKAYLFADVKNKNYGLGLAGYSNWKINKHIEHYIGGQFLGEWIDSFYEDLYLKYRPRGFSIAPRFSTGVAFTVWKRLSLGIEGNIGPGFVFREQRFKGVYLSVGLGANIGVKF